VTKNHEGKTNIRNMEGAGKVRGGKIKNYSIQAASAGHIKEVLINPVRRIDGRENLSLQRDASKKE